MHCAVQDQHAPDVNNRVASSQGCKNGRKTDHGIYMFCGLTVFPLRCEVFIVRNRSYRSYFLQQKKGNLYAKYIGCTLPRWTPVRGAAAVVHHGLILSHISQGHDGYQQSTPPHPSSPTLTHRQRSRLLIGMGLWHSIPFAYAAYIRVTSSSFLLVVSITGAGGLTSGRKTDRGNAWWKSESSMADMSFALRF